MRLFRRARRSGSGGPTDVHLLSVCVDAWSQVAGLLQVGILLTLLAGVWGVLFHAVDCPTTPRRRNLRIAMTSRCRITVAGVLRLAQVQCLMQFCPMTVDASREREFDSRRPLQVGLPHRLHQNKTCRAVAQRR
jgi:hypothetical protein